MRWVGLSLIVGMAVGCAGGEGTDGPVTGVDSAASASTGSDSTASSSTMSGGTLSTTTDPYETGDTTSPGTAESGIPPGCGDGVVEPPEACDDGNSFDADGCNTDCRPSGELLWQHTFGTGFGEVDQAFDVAAASDGSFYATAAVSSGAGAPTDAWLRKFSSIGGMLQTETHAGAGGGNDQFRSVAVDNDGNVYIAGYESIAEQGVNAWLRKYAADGTAVWTDTYNGPNSANDVYDAVELDADGNLLVAGYHNTVGGGHDVLLRKFDPADGSVLWTRTFSGDAASHDIAQGVAPTDDGHIYVVGYETVTNEGRNMWLGKFDTDGNLLWERGYNGPDSLNDYMVGVAAGKDGDAFVCGYEETDPETAGRPWNWFVRRYDADGIIVWTHNSSGDTAEGAHCFGIARDADGNFVAVGGEVHEAVRDILVRKYTPDGDVLWTTFVQGGGPGPDYARDVFVAPDNEIYVAGAIDVGSDVRDVWVARFTP